MIANTNALHKGTKRNGGNTPTTPPKKKILVIPSLASVMRSNISAASPLCCHRSCRHGILWHMDTSNTHLNKHHLNVLVIIPAYNEQESIVSVVRSVITAGYDYVVVNDGSTDETLSICDRNGFNVLSLPKTSASAAASKQATNTRFSTAMTWISSSTATASTMSPTYPASSSRSDRGRISP